MPRVTNIRNPIASDTNATVSNQYVRLEQLTSGGGGSGLGTYYSVSVANIAIPTELRAVNGSEVGRLCVAYNATALGVDSYTVYAWDTDRGAQAEVLPYIVNATSGTGAWIAIGGRYGNNVLSLRDDLNVGDVTTTNSLVVTTDATIGDDLTVTDQTNLNHVTITGNFLADGGTFGGNLSVDGDLSANANITNGGRYLADSQPGFDCVWGGSQAVTSGAAGLDIVTPTFTWTEAYDIGAQFSGGSFTVPAYANNSRFNFLVAMSGTNATPDSTKVNIVKILKQTGGIGAFNEIAAAAVPAGGDSFYVPVNTIERLSTGDVIKLNFSQDTGANSTLQVVRWIAYLMG